MKPVRDVGGGENDRPFVGAFPVQGDAHCPPGTPEALRHGIRWWRGTTSWRRSGAGQIRPCEVLADVEERLARGSGDGRGEAVAEVQGRGLPALAAPGRTGHHHWPVLGGEGDDRK